MIKLINIKVFVANMIVIFNLIKSFYKLMLERLIRYGKLVIVGYKQVGYRREVRAISGRVQNLVLFGVEGIVRGFTVVLCWQAL